MAAAAGGKFGLWEEIWWIAGSGCTNWKMVNEWRFLTIFLLKLGYNLMQVGGSSGRAKFGMWEKMPRIAGSRRTHWYNWKNGEWTNRKVINAWWFLTMFCMAAWSIETQVGGSSSQVKFGLWVEIWWIAGSPRKQQFNWNEIIESVFLVRLPLVVKPYQMIWNREWPI